MVTACTTYFNIKELRVSYTRFISRRCHNGGMIGEYDLEGRGHSRGNIPENARGTEKNYDNFSQNRRCSDTD
jgi:hypothetical protein